MTWTNVYLVCFLLGFFLSAVSWLLGVAGLHPHIHAHGGPHGHVHVHADAPHVGGAHSHAASAGAPSAINFSTLMAFLAWFGGAGYLLTRYTELWPVAALFVASGAGLAGATIVFWVMAKVLWSAEENLDADDYDVVGLLGTVSSPIRRGGTGEILFEQAIDEIGRFDDGADEQEALARIGVVGELQQRARELDVVGELLRAFAEPVVERSFARAKVGGELGVKSRRVGDEIAGVHLEEAREELTRMMRQMRARAALDLREIRLAEGGVELGADGADDFLLAHLAAEAAQFAFHLAQRSDFLAEGHCN